ncbi:MAG TPA: class I SAM-dependent methyltransferase [Verrucomicrobiae bacterium]|jgi:SAM-dependent methyltransferase|nr:class I SAM-dependent methyltransferase [Verrucomicrobiae bacterium]
MLGWLKEPSLKGLQPGTVEFFARQKALILDRPLMKRCYDDWYARLLADIASVPGPGALVELGSGGSYLKMLEPAVITSDVSSGIAEQVIDARQLPFPDASIRALLLTHVFHHIPDVEAFLREAERALVPGGVISMIDVAHTPFARFFFRNFHHEPYEDSQAEWRFAQGDSMMDSNQALTWMVFVRDRARFESRHPGLKIECLELMPWFTYFLSGGVTMRYMIPGFINPILHGIECLLTPAAPLFSLSWHIRVRKIAAKKF